MKAVQIGAGKIGRGFLGQLLCEGGYEITFVDVLPDLIARLTARGSYPLHLVTESNTEILTIPVASAFDARRETAQAARALATADLAGTSVGVAHFPAVAETLGAAITARALAGHGPLDILLCENQWHAATMMRELIRPHLAAPVLDYFGTQIGLVETVIGRIVPAPSAEMLAADPLMIAAEPYKELPIAQVMLRGPIPPLPGLVAAADFDAYEARKLYLANAGHAALAYLGWQNGLEFIWQCLAHPTVRAICQRALSESAQALCREYDFRLRDLEVFCDDLMHRYANKALGDTVARVAADPVRKLRPTDRLIGTAGLCLRHGIVPNALAQIIAAALTYDDPDDLRARELQDMRKTGGDESVLADICGLSPGSPLALLIEQHL